jgi:hypothetical protein
MMLISSGKIPENAGKTSLRDCVALGCNSYKKGVRWEKSPPVAHMRAVAMLVRAAGDDGFEGDATLSRLHRKRAAER